MQISTRVGLAGVAWILGACAGPIVARDTSSATPPRVDTGFVRVSGGQLYYEVAGAGPPVILVHGGNLDSRMWNAQFAALAQEHRVVRYDARGFGRSSPANVSYAAHEDLLALFDSLNIRRASLVGLSLGGRIASDFALAHGGMVDRLVLASPGLSGWQYVARDTSWATEWRSARARKDSVGMAIAWLGSAWMRPAMEHPELRERLTEWVTASAGYWMGLVQHGDTERPLEPPALGRTRLIQAPTLIVVGSRDVLDILHIADTLVATMPHAQRVIMDGAGHMVNLEQSDRFTDVVRRFLRPAGG